jgi:dUTPase
MDLIKWGRIDENRQFTMPHRSTDHAVAHDLYLPHPVDIYPGRVERVDLNINCLMPENYCAKVYVRSSIGCKYNIRLANGTGIIDADYYDEWALFLYMPDCDLEDHDDPDERIFHWSDTGERCFRFKQNERIAQVTFEEVPTYCVSDITYKGEHIKDLILRRGSNRRGGFGSTGK